MTDDRIYALDPIYNGRNSTPIDHAADKHNAWRARLPEHCWLCQHFDSCNPSHKCRHQIDIDIQAQHGVKHDKF